ncbi:MAG TPA: hypothetical protein DEF45_24875 [Rhodopirellula sp.]|nr:hypothetical protein [Rhodopirellula sp.]
MEEMYRLRKVIAFVAAVVWACCWFYLLLLNEERPAIRMYNQLHRDEETGHWSTLLIVCALTWGSAIVFAVILSKLSQYTKRR